MTTHPQSENEVGFICEAVGPLGLFGVFEDDGDTGYLYLYDTGGRGVLKHIHVYDRSSELSVRETDVKVVWSSDLQKCGVLVFDKFRGIIDIAKSEEGRVWMKNRNSPGIADQEWLQGFI